MTSRSARNRLVRIERRGEGCDEAGQPTDGWMPVATIWASIRHTSGMEAIKGGAEVSTVKASIRIRYRAGIGAGMVVTHGATRYEIKAVLPDEARRGYCDLVCEVVA